MVGINDFIQGTLLTPGFTYEQIFRICVGLQTKAWRQNRIGIKTGRFYEDEMYDGTRENFSHIIRGHGSHKMMERVLLNY
jgi:hypothetical protein